MMLLDDVLEFNRKFVENKDYEKYEASKLPNKKLVVVSCMDARLIELLPKAMNLKNGDATFLKTGGAIVSHPFGSILRSILVAINELNANEIWIVGHHDCGMNHINPTETIRKMVERGIPQNTIETLEQAGINIINWLHGFDSVLESVRQGVEIIRNHPLIPQNVPVHGLVINPDTGALEVIENGYNHTNSTEQ